MNLYNEESFALGGGEFLLLCIFILVVQKYRLSKYNQPAQILRWFELEGSVLGKCPHHSL